MRIRVIIDIIKFFVWCMRIIIGKELFKGIEIKYKRFFIFCYICGKIGYVDRDCLENDTGEDDDIEFKYGD